jgi:hypothetical protein
MLLEKLYEITMAGGMMDVGKNYFSPNLRYTIQ